MSLSIMPTEILLLVFELLDFEDLVSLLPTCKHIRQVAFYSLSKIIDDRMVKTISEFQEADAGRTATVPIEDLQVLRSSEYDTSRGLHIGFTVVDGDNQTTTKTSAYDISHFLDLINIAIRSGKMDILNAELYISEPVSKDGKFSKLFVALKHYSLTRSPLEFSITSLSGRMSPASMTRLFDTSKLTKLAIFFGKNYKDSWARGSTSISDEIKDFQELLKRTSNLEQLEILSSGPIGLGFELTPSEDTIQHSELEGLREAFSNLKKLHTMRLDTFLFSSSFFIPIPENVKTLLLAHVAHYPIQWWDEFAKYPFKNLESLKLNLCGTQECFEQGGLGTHLTPTWPSEGTKGHMLGDVELRGLKDFYCDEAQILYLPLDLISCLLKRNPGLQEYLKRQSAKQYSAMLLQRCKEELMQAMACRMFELEVENEMEKRFMENGPEEDDLKDCALGYLSRFSSFLTNRPVVLPPGPINPRKPESETKQLEDPAEPYSDKAGYDDNEDDFLVSAPNNLCSDGFLAALERYKVRDVSR
ncbi:hypothetical protein TWF788_008969 [Orbilia oligospora]|uniref:F-box domain-containing protein n=2 Tax=Orbilia oligospora TaxID=2813651 RepID=A0A7C8Q330_ORBOL|nr:hypothetical protein TWF788_008969 [Orbilia oligospora]